VEANANIGLRIWLREKRQEPIEFEQGKNAFSNCKEKSC